jgi:hypothetical protein
MIQSQQVLEWQQQARTEERAKAVLEVLQERFAPIPEPLVEQVCSLRDLAMLQRWFTIAIRAETLDELLGQVQAQGGE